MKYTKCKRLLGLVLALGLVLSGCGDREGSSLPASTVQSENPSTTAAVVPQTTQSPREQTGYAYQAAWSDLELEGAPERLFFLGDTLLLEVSGEDGSRRVYDPLTGSTLEADGLSGTVLTIAPGEGELWYCVEAEEGLILSSLPAEGGSVRQTVSLADSQGLYPYTMAVDGDGSFYLLGWGWLRVYSSQGKALSTFDLGQEQGINLVRLSNGQVILSTQRLGGSSYQGAVKLLNTESIGATLTEASKTYRAYPGWQGTALLSDGGSLYALDGASSTMTAVLDWIDTDINPETLASVAARDAATIYVVSSTQSATRLGTLTQVPVSQTQERTVIHVGYCLGDPELTSALNALTVDFNQSQEDFRVHLVNYQSYSDGSARLLADAGDLDLILAEEIGDSVELTDLSTLFDDQVGVSTLTDGLYQALTAQGSVTGLPLYFTLDTLVGTASTLGSQEGWTPAEFAQTVAQHPEAAVLQYSNAYDTLDTLLERDGSYMTDYASLLTAVQSIPVEDSDIYALAANQAQEALPCLKDGSLLLWQVNISDFSTWLGLQKALEGDMVLKGYPSESGNGGILQLSPQQLAIPAASAHPGEAWDFLKAILSSDFLSQYQGGFPVLEAAYTQAEQEAMAGLTYEASDGTSATTGGQVNLENGTYEVEPLTQAQADTFRSYLRGLCGIAGDTASLRQQAREALKSVLESGTDPAQAAKGIGG